MHTAAREKLETNAKEQNQFTFQVFENFSSLLKKRIVKYNRKFWFVSFS